MFWFDSEMIWKPDACFIEICIRFLFMHKYFYTLLLSIWQKFEDIDLISFSVVQKALWDVVQPIFEQAFGLSAVVQNLYGLDIFVNMNANEVTPDICNHNNGK